MMTSEKLSLENFVIWLITATSDDKFCYRHCICDTVRTLGKDKVLDELERQAQSFKNIGEAVKLAQLVRAIK